MGLVLLATAALGLLALVTYSPADPTFALVPVENRAGAMGATLAGTLVSGIGFGAFAALGAAAVLGVRLILGTGIPGPLSRFSVGTVMLVLALSCGAPTALTLWPDWQPPAVLTGIAHNHVTCPLEPGHRGRRKP